MSLGFKLRKVKLLLFLNCLMLYIIKDKLAGGNINGMSYL